MTRPKLLIFDVNETLLDIESLGSLFQRLFGDSRVLREWFNQLILYSMTITLCGSYERFGTLGRAALQMIGAIHGVKIGEAELDALGLGMQTMPAHKDVEPALKRLKAAGFRLVTLTNSAPNPDDVSPLAHAGIAAYFEKRFSVHTVQAFKPAPAVYRMVLDEMNLPASACCMAAAHAWDILGAQSLGMTGALIARPGNAPLPAPGLPNPTWIASDLRELADQLIAPELK
jgi:2-haloacid dehalogenase